MIRNILLGSLLILTACKRGEGDHDASGVFESDEVIVSAEVPGRILRFGPIEGSLLKKGDTVAVIDATNLALQKEQVEASIRTLPGKTVDVSLQVDLLKNQLKVQETQMATLQREQRRFTNLVREQAATQKQLDDINSQLDQLKAQMDVTRQQIRVQQNVSGTQNRSILSETEPLNKRVAQLQDQLNRSVVTSPMDGTLLTKYAQAGEVAGTGKALFKMADLGMLRLRAYFSGDQLVSLKLGQQVSVRVDDGKGGYKAYQGQVTWISDKAEFTPKTIQTKDERANLVYAVKIDVKNDGFLKLGMYGEVVLTVGS